MTIGERIKRRRKELRMRQIELADYVGYRSVSTVSKVEKGIITIPINKLNKVAEALKTTTAYLMGYEEENKTKKNLELKEEKKMKKSKIEELLKLIEGQDEAFATFEKARDLLMPLEEIHFLASMTTMFKAYGLEHHTNGTLLALKCADRMMEFDSGALEDLVDNKTDKIVLKILREILNDDEDDEENG